jgi:hypothetical protein
MRMIYIEAEQGHAVPKSVLSANGPFGKYEPVKGDPIVPVEFPRGATAQNEMHEVILFECNGCGATVREPDLDHHECKE